MATGAARIYGIAALNQSVETLQNGCRWQNGILCSISRWQFDIRRHYAISALRWRPRRHPSLVGRSRQVQRTVGVTNVRQSGEPQRRDAPSNERSAPTSKKTLHDPGSTKNHTCL